MTRIASLLALAMLGGCAATPANPPAARAAADGSDIQLAVGEAAQLADGSRLSYLRLVNDSRCPPDVQCVWAGDAEIELRWQPASGPAQDTPLHTASIRGNTQARIGERTVTLVALERGDAPKATLKIERAD